MLGILLETEGRSSSGVKSPLKGIQYSLSQQCLAPPGEREGPEDLVLHKRGWPISEQERAHSQEPGAGLTLRNGAKAPSLAAAFPAADVWQ